MLAPPIRLGLLPVCDAAPVFLAAQQGLFAAAGLQVQLAVKESWAALATPLAAGELDGVVALPPLVMITALAAPQPPPFMVPMSISRGGSAVTLSTRLAEAFAAGGITRAAAGTRLRLAIGHEYSSHELLLRYWLATNGLDPDHDVILRNSVPAALPGQLAAGEIDGFCAGAPWGHVAASTRLGFIAVPSVEIWQGHPEKCLVLRDELARSAPEAVLALLGALLTASKLCADPRQRQALATLLAAPDCLNVPAPVLAGALDPAQGGPLFTGQYPSPRRAGWFARQLLRWGKAPARVLEMPGLLYRPDIFLEAGGEMKPEGMELFCDGPKRPDEFADDQPPPPPAGGQTAARR